ncbi:MAG: beta-ketoacyl-ACP synthase III, partial [Bdellovibrionota bacterium]
MAAQFPFRSRISGTGSYLPEKVLTNFDLEKMVDTNNQWIIERTGIERRHVAAPDEATSDLGLKAAQKALAEAGLTAKDLDCIIFGTVSGDQPMPSTACYLQHKLGCRNIMAFDLNAACSGFLYGLTVADQFIKTGVYKHILVVGAEILTRYMNYKDRETCILFGDAAGAWIVSQTTPDDPNIIMDSHMHAEGSLADLLVLQAGGSKVPFTQNALDLELNFMKMRGREIFKNAVRTMAVACKETLTNTNTKLEDIEWLVPHQANSRILEAVASQLDFPPEKMVVAVHETGNTSAASIPTGFQMARDDGRIKRGQLILFQLITIWDFLKNLLQGIQVPLPYSLWLFQKCLATNTIPSYKS